MTGRKLIKSRNPFPVIPRGNIFHVVKWQVFWLIPIMPAPSHPYIGQWPKSSDIILPSEGGITAAGTVGDFHPVPYYALSGTISTAKLINSM